MSIYAGYWYKNHADDVWRCDFTDTELLDSASPDTFTFTEGEIAKILLKGHEDKDLLCAMRTAMDNRYKVDPGLEGTVRQLLADISNNDPPEPSM